MNFVQEMLLSEANVGRDPSVEHALRAVLESLDRLEGFIGTLSEAQFSSRTAERQSSVGSHVRHCLDHVAALVRGLTEGIVNYDHRQRGTDDELSPSAAIQRLIDLRAALERSAPAYERYLCVRSMLTAQGQSVRAHSSWSRELVFVLSHTIHHQAMMAATARTVGAEVDSRFGYAPSTLAYLDPTPCVQSA